jgi:hypothetical protein
LLSADKLIPLVFAERAEERHTAVLWQGGQQAAQPGDYLVWHPPARRSHRQQPGPERSEAL